MPSDIRLTIPIDIRVSAQASSQYTREQVERRMCELRERFDAEAREELAFLSNVMQKHGWV